MQLHVHQVKTHLAPQCCHGLVGLDLPHASPQSNKYNNEMKQTPGEKKEYLMFNRHIQGTLDDQKLPGVLMDE